MFCIICGIKRVWVSRINYRDGCEKRVSVNRSSVPRSPRSTRIITIPNEPAFGNMDVQGGVGRDSRRPLKSMHACIWTRSYSPVQSSVFIFACWSVPTLTAAPELGVTRGQDKE